MSVDVVVQNVSATSDVPSNENISRWAQTALNDIEQEKSELTVRVVDENEIRELNRTYRGKDQATNVLSFPFTDPPQTATNILGDVVVCASVIKREAQEQNKAQDAHWAHMIVHGVLHLCGYDHEQQTQAEQMERMETTVLAQLGFPAPYASR
ncbi:MAG: rRNA maturation RNase YbeY [Gammaproteobacteria bacterium]|nr:rRNA maturation RNase YbeY [Gammaproteobacteria bacterium]